MSLSYRTFVGEDIAEVVDDLARLRITVFRDWPYLYDGDPEYERGYLQSYARGDTILAGAFDGDRMVGASTGMPLSDHADEFGEAFTGQEIDFNDAFYCAESVLLKDFRGHGVGHRFFDLREAHARGRNFTFSTFCSVVRPADHPLRPKGYRALDPFWRARGYAPLPGVLAAFSWRDIGETRDSRKPLQFWAKRL